MSSEPTGSAGALLLCRAGVDAVETVAQLLREQMLLAPAGDEWSVLVPEGKPWLHGDEQVDRVLTGWATALAVASPGPVLALWWDADRSGYTLAAGFRRTPVSSGRSMCRRGRPHTGRMRTLVPTISVRRRSPVRPYITWRSRARPIGFRALPPSWSPYPWRTCFRSRPCV